MNAWRLPLVLAASAILVTIMIFLSDQSAARTAAQGQIWEYCAINRVGQNNTSIVYFTDTGIREERIGDASSEKVVPPLSMAISKLGREGWELVGEGPSKEYSSGSRTLYFKRPKS